MTLAELEQMAHALGVEFGPEREVLVADHQSWLTSATERVIGYFVFATDPEQPVVLVYAAPGEVTRRLGQ